MTEPAAPAKPVECEACRLGDDRHEPATQVCDLQTEGGLMLMCDRHASMVSGWAGAVSQIVP